MAKVDDYDYRVRVGHLINAVEEIRQAVEVLADMLPTTSLETAKAILAKTKTCADELEEAGYEL